MRMSLCLLIATILVTAGKGVSTTDVESQAHGYSADRDANIGPCQDGNGICGAQIVSLPDPGPLCTCPSGGCPLDNDHRVPITNPQSITELYACRPINRYEQCSGSGAVAVTDALTEMKCRCTGMNYMLDEVYMRVTCAL
uniref:Gsp_64 putative toxin n=1 Tax=Gemmula speciosa TaxID=439592 RepID=A0A098LXR4_GEMSP